MYFYFKTRTAHFPIRRVNETPQKIEVPNLKFLRDFIAVRWEYMQTQSAQRTRAPSSTLE